MRAKRIYLNTDIQNIWKFKITRDLILYCSYLAVNMVTVIIIVIIVIVTVLLMRVRTYVRTYRLSLSVLNGTSSLIFFRCSPPPSLWTSIICLLEKMMWLRKAMRR